MVNQSTWLMYSFLKRASKRFSKRFSQPLTSTRPISILPLPDDVLIHCLSFLEPQDLCKLELVCSAFRTIATSDTLWRAICKRLFLVEKLTVEKCWKQQFLAELRKKVMILFTSVYFSKSNLYKLLNKKFGNRWVFIDATKYTPNLTEMMKCSCILVFGGNFFDQSVELGNRLASYVDSGGCVVTAMYANCSPTANYSIKGRWQTDRYDAVEPENNFHSFFNNEFRKTISLARVKDIQQLKSWDWLGKYEKARYARFNIATAKVLNPNSRVIAVWNGTDYISVAEGKNRRVVTLNMEIHDYLLELVVDTIQYLRLREVHVR